MSPKKRQAPTARSSLTWADLTAIAGIVVGILTVAVGPLYLYLNSFDNRLGRVEERLGEVREDLARIEGRLESIENAIRRSDLPDPSSGLPPPAESVLWIALEASNNPFSIYLVDNGTWEGVWTDVAKNWSSKLGFPDVQFLAAPAGADAYPVDELEYLAGFASEADPTAEALEVQGWSRLPLDSYFEAAGYGPFTYSIFVSPRLAEEGYLAAFITALKQVPLDSWAEWGKTIEEGLKP